ncbi:hypothetical protein TorRG33x02_331760 [Trema orientale]|uniref:Uncharacterized protein n=1 Tax=Trema orientale TaxID=63057 RepID=A0A2P5B5S2_TREOI|nr:hypothetical protein TorRG33x02_331760 [Trema orientale]
MPRRVGNCSRKTLAQCVLDTHRLFRLVEPASRWARASVNFWSIKRRSEKRHFLELSREELFNLKTIIMMDPKECHYKGLVTNSALASMGLFLYLESNLVLRRWPPAPPALPKDEVEDEVKRMLSELLF